MKLSYLLMIDRIPAVGSLSLHGDRYDLSYDAGLVSVTAKDQTREGLTYLVPLARVSYMVAEKAKK